MHFYGFFKEWRKNPVWSISCCLGLFLPLVNLSGEINDLARTNVLDTQLDTGHVEDATGFGALSDNGVIDFVLGEEEQNNNGPEGVQEDSRDNPHLHEQTKENDTTSNIVAAKGSVYTDLTLERGGRLGDNPSDWKADDGDEDNSVKKKSHQETQTELSTVFSIADDLVVHVPRGKTIS